MTVLAVTAKSLAQFGANLEITTDSKFLATTVEELVTIAKAKGGHITIHSGKYLSTSLQKFAQIGGHNVTIRI